MHRVLRLQLRGRLAQLQLLHLFSSPCNHILLAGVFLDVSEKLRKD